MTRTAVVAAALAVSVGLAGLAAVGLYDKDVQPERHAARVMPPEGTVDGSNESDPSTSSGDAASRVAEGGDEQVAPLPSEPPAEPDDAEGETTVFRRDQNTVISRGQHDSCKIVTYEEARAEYSVLILAPPTEPGLSRVEWELCDFGGGDRSVRVLLVPDHVGDTRSLTTEDVIAEGGRYLMQSQAASRPEPHFLMIQQRRQPVRVRGEEASIFVAGLNSRRERFCMLEWAEPEIDGYRVYYFNAPPGACDDGRAVEWANALVELQP